MASIILTKESNENDIKRYFEAILKLSQSKDRFPVSLDDVWMLVYGQKSDAVEALKSNFIEEIDFQVLRENPQNSKGGRPVNVYKLTTSCLEFFIARKVRLVFEVYRKVFHNSIETVRRISTQKESKPKNLNVSKKRVEAIFTWVEGLSSMFNLSNLAKFKVLEKEAELLSLPMPDEIKSEGAVARVSKLLKEYNVMSGNKPMTSKEFNDLLVKHGYMRDIERVKSNGKNDSYRNLTEQGLKYGINDWNKYSHTPKTEVYFFIDKFTDLLKVLGLK